MKDRNKYSLRDLFPAYSRLPLILAIVWNFSAYYGGRLLGQGGIHRSMETALDGRIPFLPWTVSIYIISYAFWVVNYCLAGRRDKQSAYRLFTADFMAKCVSLVIFVAMPTTGPRPEVTGSGLWPFLMRVIYYFDAPDNLFPSIHCIASFFSAVGISGEKRIPVWYRAFSWILAVAIFISTLTTSQHVIADVIGGVLIAAAAYALAGLPRVRQMYMCLVERIAKLIHL